MITNASELALRYLPFLPMLPIQILLNNFIYDFSQITIPSDNIDIDMIEKPKRWSMNFVKKFMLVFGPISSVFDILTFLVLFHIFGLNSANMANSFQTGWFLESLATQTLVIFVIRTKKLPFIKSMPSAMLIFSSIACLAFGWLLPYLHLGKFFYFAPLQINILLAIMGIVFAYLCVVEIAKRIFYKYVDY